MAHNCILILFVLAVILIREGGEGVALTVFLLFNFQMFNFSKIDFRPQYLLSFSPSLSILHTNTL